MIYHLLCLFVRKHSLEAPRIATGQLEALLTLTIMALKVLADSMGPHLFASENPKSWAGRNSTEIAFDLPAPARVHLAVYDLLGRKVARLVDGALSATDHVQTETVVLID